MSDPLHRYMGRPGRFAPLRLCVSPPFCAETYGDSCNSSLQLFTKRTHCPPPASEFQAGCSGWDGFFDFVLVERLVQGVQGFQQRFQFSLGFGQRQIGCCDLNLRLVHVCALVALNPHG
jgi:hypothetical protein